MRCSSLNVLPARESSKTLGCTRLRPNPDLVPVRETRIASVPIQGTRMTMITTNPHVNHLILLQLPLRIIRGKRELGKTTIVPRRLRRCCLQGPLPLTLLKSLPRRLKPADPNDMLKSLNSQGMCMVINIPHKSKKRSGDRKSTRLNSSHYSRSRMPSSA